MTVKASAGPLIVFGQEQLPQGVLSANRNPDAGPSLFYQSVGLLDPRAQYTYDPGGAQNSLSAGWLIDTVITADYAPSAISTTNIAAAQPLTGGAPVTLASTSVTGITVNDSTANPQTGQLVTGLLRIDNKPGFVAFGQTGAVSIWDPANPPIGRGVSLTSTANLSAINFTVSGFDAYGNPQTQTLAGPNNNTVNTAKTFKWIKSVTPSANNAGPLSVGTADIYGFPIRCDQFAYADIYWNNVIQLFAQFTAAVTIPATASTGDVRGTFTAPNASDGTKRLQLFISPSVANISSNTGLFGVVPV